MPDRRARLREMRVYAVLTEEYCRHPVLDVARELLRGGTDVIQMREKSLTDCELLQRAEALRELTHELDALFIVNDRPDIAMLSGADGVHLGQEDLPPNRVRELVGPDLLIGLSTHDVKQAAAAHKQDADYIGVGPVFPTPSKEYHDGIGLDMVSRLCDATDLPTVGIGGITAKNAFQARSAGATAVAAIRALCGVDDPQAAARSFGAESEERPSE